MARPKKQKELKRNHHIMLRLNDTEYDIVTENAQTANLPVAEYARKQVMNQRIKMKYKVTKMAGVFHGDTETHSK